MWTALRSRAAKPKLSENTEIEIIEGGETYPDAEEDMISVPFNGLIGQENGQIFEKPLEQFDATQTPTKNTEDMPGAPGSDERNDAIMNRIKERVADLKSKDEWRNDDENFGKNPLSDILITEIMVEQLKVIRPFESFSEFALTLSLLIFTTGFLTIFINVNNGIDEKLVLWWANTDFEFLSSVVR